MANKKVEEIDSVEKMDSSSVQDVSSKYGEEADNPSPIKQMDSPTSVPETNRSQNQEMGSPSDKKVDCSAVEKIVSSVASMTSFSVPIPKYQLSTLIMNPPKVEGLPEEPVESYPRKLMHTAKSSSRSAAQSSSRSAPQSPTRSAAQSSSRSAPQSPTRSAAQNPTRSAAQSPPREAVKRRPMAGMVSRSIMKMENTEINCLDLRIYCPHCTQKYRYQTDGGKYEPRVLSCDHLACSSCNDQMFLSGHKCLICSKSLKIVDMDLQLRKLTKEAVAINNPEFSHIVFSMNNEHLNGLLKFVDKRLSNSSKHLPLINNLQNHVQNYEEKMDILREEFDDVFTKFSFLKVKFDAQKSNPRFFDLHHYSKADSKLLLDKLMEKISKGEKLYAASIKKNKEMKFGKVSLFKDFGILVHSLRIEKIDNDACYFWLEEFKELFKNCLVVFMTFPCNEETVDGEVYTLTFDLLRSQRESGFLELCTGEHRVSFTNAEYTKLKGEMGSFEITLPGRYQNFCGEMDRNAKFDKETVIRYLSAANWEIRTIENYSDLPKNPCPSRNIVAKLNLDANFSLITTTVRGSRIIDSGIGAFHYEEY